MNIVYYFFQENTNIENYIKNTRNGVKNNLQPYLVCCKGQRRWSYLVQADNLVVKPHQNDPVTSFDLLF